MESHANGWAHVAGANGWRGWVDGRRLVKATTSQSTVDGPFGITMPAWWPPEIPVVPAAGAVLVLLGSFLPWLTFGGLGSASAWDIGVIWLFTGSDTVGGLKIGFLLFAVLAVALPALTKRPLPEAVLPAIGLVAMGLALLTMVRGFVGDSAAGFDIRYNPGLGLFISLIGGAILAIDRLRAWIARPRSRAGR